MALFISKPLNYALKGFEGAGFFLLWLCLETYSMVEQKQTILKCMLLLFYTVIAFMQLWNDSNLHSRPNKVNSHYTTHTTHTQTNRNRHVFCLINVLTLSASWHWSVFFLSVENAELMFVGS